MSRHSKSRRDAKKKKAKKSRNRLKSNNNIAKKPISSGPVMTMMENPLSGITDEQRKELISELGKNGKDKVVEIFESLNDVLRQYDPITLISILSGYGLTVGAGEGGVQSKELSGGLNQAHVELFQALALQIPENELGALPVTPDIVQNVWEKLTEISYAFKCSRMNVELLESSNIEMAINQIQELIRSHTQMVRNWGFHSQVVGISKEIYSHFDGLIQNKFGFSATNAIDFFKVLTDHIEGNLSERFNILSDLKSTKKPYDMLVKYHELIGQGKEEADRFSKNIDINNISQKNLFFMLLSHFDLGMSDYYFVDSDELSTQLDLDKDIVDNVLNHFSYRFGDLGGEKKEFFFLENPVWKRPIISSSSGYYCVLPQLFFSFVLNTLDEIVEGIDKNSLHNRRADYLESKIEEIVKKRFPESQVVSGLKWRLGEAQYETDLIAFIDSHAIIIEAKSQKISRPALRGAPDRIKRHLEQILIEPGIQSSRLEQRLNELRVQDAPDDPLLTKIPVDIHSINKVLRVSVSLEDFATLQTNLRLFNDAGWIPNDFAPCPSMNLADFETLFDFLEHPVQIIHYLLRRTELEGKYKFMGDELDYMGLYITTLLNVGNMVSDDKAEIIISGMSEPLDKYYMSKDQGILIDKPQPKVSPLFKKIFRKLEERSNPRWTEIGCILNRFPPDDQSNLTRYIKDLSRLVNRNWQVDGHKNIAVYRPPESSEYALAVVLFKEKNRDRRYEFIDHASALGLEPEHVRYCLIIAINIDKDDLPYHYIALAENRDAE
ncbi:hypothetical protein K8B33_07990 [Alcanivorax sp. JB21]|uniref:hypothetical protein n=1 Tax=Alcanivorax limicola TaxID=2874102 RepID=UPI001CC1549C|nr:hypothetical protein [Alcanivorax limicola]MBZ2189034.1 hypothetical protein [Alcanivorax limicola]